MELSAYQKVFRSGTGPSSLVLFSTKMASTIIVPESMLNEIREGVVTEEEAEILRDLGFLVQSSRKEKAEMRYFIDELNGADTIFAAEVVMNLDCNLACRYCFEGQRKGEFYMTEETADQVVKFVEHSVRSRSNVTDVRLTFYGGEPLLSPGLLTHISEKIQNRPSAMKKDTATGGLLLPTELSLLPSTRRKSILPASGRLQLPSTVRRISTTGLGRSPQARDLSI